MKETKCQSNWLSFWFNVYLCAAVPGFRVCFSHAVYSIIYLHLKLDFTLKIDETVSYFLIQCLLHRWFSSCCITNSSHILLLTRCFAQCLSSLILIAIMRYHFWISVVFFRKTTFFVVGPNNKLWFVELMKTENLINFRALNSLICDLISFYIIKHMGFDSILLSIFTRKF